MSTDVRNQADWLVSEGNLAAAPNLYYWGRRIRCLISTVRLGERPLSELDATRRWLTEHERCTGKVGVIGFCMGGDFALMMARIKVYPDAGHGFLSDHDPAELPLWVKALAKVVAADFHEPSARDARRRIIGFFDLHLKA